MNDPILHNIFLNLTELSDIEFQKRAWNGEVAHYASDYVELRCSIFDDCFIEENVNSIWLKQGIDSDWLEKFKHLIEMLHNFHGERMSSEEIFNSMQWKNISILANDIKNSWPFHEK